MTESAQGPTTQPARVVRAAARDGGNDPETPTDVEFTVNVQAKDATMDVGVPLTQVNGGAELSGSTKAGKLSDLVGKIDIGSLVLAGRPATDLRATLYKPAEHDAMQADHSRPLWTLLVFMNWYDMWQSARAAGRVASVASHPPVSTPAVGLASRES